MTLVPLERVRAYMRARGDVDDDVLATVLEAAVGVCEEHTGKTWAQTEVTDVMSGGVPALRLTRPPATTVTSVTESGVTLSGTEGVDWVLDPGPGLLWRGTTTVTLTWATGRRNVVVTYLAGPAPADVPDRIVHGVLECAAHMWQTRSGGAGLPANRGAATEWDPRQGYSVPRRVLELWGDRVGGIA